MPFNQRFQRHRDHLRAGEGPPLLQLVYDELGIDNLEFVPLKEFPIAEVHEREREAIDRLKPALNIYGSRSKAHLTTVRLFEYGGHPVNLRELARLSGIGAMTILARHRRGLSGSDLIASPHQAPRKKYTSHKR